jgi:hypothetical protein
MDNGPRQGRTALMLTLDVIRAEHGRLLEAGAQTILDVPDYLRKVKSFVDGLVESGAYFDETAERRAIQAYLDHWTAELANHAAREERTGLSHLEIRAFDADALRKLQDQFINPFETLSRDLTSLSQAGQRSASGVLKLLEDKAKATGLRFQEGVLKEIASQVASDPQGAALCEFCLWHLFEDPETRSGNKISRPSGEIAFSCTAYLVDKAGEMCQAQPERERNLLMGALARFGSVSPVQATSKLLPRSAIHKLKYSTLHAFVLYTKTTLDLDQFLTTSRLTFDRGNRGLELVHDALMRRWVDLAAEIAARTARMRQNRKMVFSAVAFTALVGVGWIAWSGLQAHRQEAATRDASAAANEGALASAQLLTTRDALWGQQYPDAAAFRSAVGAAMYSAARDHFATQLDMSLHAVKANDSMQGRQTLTNAISAVIGFLAQVGALGELPPYPKVVDPRNPDPDEPDSKKCATTQRTYCVRIGELLLPIPGANPDEVISFPLANHDGTRLATALSRPGGVMLRAFELRRGEAAARRDSAASLAGGLWSLRPMGEGVQVAGCRAGTFQFSPETDGVVIFQCAESGKWSYVDFQRDEGAYTTYDTPGLSPHDARASQGGPKCPPTSGHRAEQEFLPSSDASVFLGPPPAKGQLGDILTAGREGYVRRWREPNTPCLHAQFFSDFVRVVTAGHPTGLALYGDDSVANYAIYHDSPPVIRVYKQSGRDLAKQVIEYYPSYGLGTPTGLRFTPNGQCLEVLAKRARPVTRKPDDYPVGITYYLMLEAKALKLVGTALEKDLADLKTREFSHAQSSATRYEQLSAYRQLVESQCGVSID